MFCKNIKVFIYIVVYLKFISLPAYSCGPTNSTPIPNASGGGTHCLGLPVTLNGSGSYDPDGGSILTYKWECIQVPAGATGCDTQQSSSPTYVFTPDKTGEYRVKLTVKDNENTWSTSSYISVVKMEQAVNVSPVDGSVNETVYTALPLKWSSVVPGDVWGYDVFFGTDQSLVTSATTQSPEFKGYQTTTSFVPTVTAGTPYYWRVDEYLSKIGGPVWQSGGVINRCVGMNQAAHGNHIEFPYVLDPGNGSFSLSAWVKKTDNDTDMYVMSQAGLNAPGRFWLRLFTDGNIGTGLRTSGGNTLVTTTPVVTTLNQWYHLTLVWDWNVGTSTGVRRLYVDGALATQDAAPIGNLESCQGRMFMGSTNVGGYYYMEGQIDDARMYTKALTLNEINDICLDCNQTGNQTDPTSADLLAHWAFDETSGYTASNSAASGSIYDGTLKKKVACGRVTGAVWSFTTLPSVDSDSDGLPDAWETQYGLDPTIDDSGVDSDGDGLSNLEEYLNALDPTNIDTDGDGMPDGWEVSHIANGLDPRVNDAGADPDNDQLTNLQEYQLSLNPAVNNSGDRWVEKEYDDAGALTKIIWRELQGGIVKIVSEKRIEYNQLGQTWRSRVLKNPNVGLDNANDHIILTTYTILSQVEKTILKSPDSTDPSYNNPDVIGVTDVVASRKTYDNFGRVEYIYDADNRQTKYTYTSGGNVDYIEKELRDSVLTKVMDYFYDGAGNANKVVDAEGHYSKTIYNSLVQVTEQVSYDCMGTPADESNDVALKQTRFEYDGLGNISRQTTMSDADAIYDPSHGSFVAIDVTRDQVVDKLYDGQGGTYPGLLSQSTGYNSNSSAPLITQFQYDEIGRQLKTIDPMLNEESVSYYPDGKIYRSTKVEKGYDIAVNDVVITTEYYYDSYGREIEERQIPDIATPAVYRSTQKSYNSFDQVSSVQYPEGNMDTYLYNHFGLKIERIADITGIYQKIVNDYDRLGRQISITSYADGVTAQITQYEFDNLNRLNKIIYPDSQFTSYLYYPDGSINTRTDQRGIVTTYQSDNLGQVTQKVATFTMTAGSNTVTENLTYDGFGRVKTANKVSSIFGPIHNSVFNYTDQGWIGQADESIFGHTTKNIIYGYDQSGNRTQTTYPDGRIVRMLTDPLGRIYQVYLNAEMIPRVQYDYTGNKLGLRTYNTSAISPVIQTNDYDNYGQLTDLKTYPNSATPVYLMNFHYNYDQNGNVDNTIFHHRSSSHINDYTYDGLDRLTMANYHSMDNETFNMDKLGNRDSVVIGAVTNNYAKNELTNRYDKTGTYDVQLSYDNAGNMISDGNGYQYVYDYENRLVEIKDSMGAGLAIYFYDALGRRVFSYVDGINKSYYYNDRQQVLSEGNGVYALQRWYVYGNYVDEVLMMIDETGASPVRYYYAHDHQYSPVGLMDVSGNLLERYEYNAYGKMTRLNPDYTPFSGAASANPYYFTGRRLEKIDNGNLELMYYRNRYYDADTGRFLHQDPLGYIDGMNLYEYVRSNPGRYVDPSGTSILPKSSITGSYEKFLDSSKGTRFIYTCRCGWLDATHLGWDKAYDSAYKAVQEVANSEYSDGFVQLTYPGLVNNVVVFYPIRKFGVDPDTTDIIELTTGKKDLMKYIPLAMLYSLFKTGEPHQLGNKGFRGILELHPQARTVNSLEDLPTNWLGAIIAAERTQNKALNKSTLIKNYCGKVLSKSEASCLHSQMTKAEHNMKNYNMTPILFNDKPAAKKCSGASPSPIFTEEVNKAKSVWDKFILGFPIGFLTSSDSKLGLFSDDLRDIHVVRPIRGVDY